MDDTADHIHAMKRLAEWMLKHPANEVTPHGPATLQASQRKMQELLQHARGVGYTTVDASEQDPAELFKTVSAHPSTLVIRSPLAGMPARALGSLWCRYVMEKSRIEEQIDPWEFVLSQFVINSRTSTESVFTPLLTTPQQFIRAITEEKRCVKCNAKTALKCCDCVVPICEACAADKCPLCSENQFFHDHTRLTPQQIEALQRGGLHSVLTRSRSNTLTDDTAPLLDSLFSDSYDPTDDIPSGDDEIDSLSTDDTVDTPGPDAAPAPTATDSPGAQATGRVEQDPDSDGQAPDEPRAEPIVELPDVSIPRAIDIPNQYARSLRSASASAAYAREETLL